MMQHSVRASVAILAVLTGAAWQGVGAVQWASADGRSSPAVARVVKLLTELKSRTEGDGMLEQKSYDKYACFCESTLARKASDIANAKDRIEELQTQILKLNANLGSRGAEVEQLRKDITANKEAQKEATEVRNGENGDYQSERVESEQCIGALEAAVKVLSGAGGKKGFLQNIQTAQLISVAGDIRGLLSRHGASSMSTEDLQVVQRFVDRPEDFASTSTASVSALQTGANPFGDYAPQSTQIQGILKGMYDAFTGDLEKSNAEEAVKQKGFEELMATKKEELATLEATLEVQSLDKAEKTKLLADSEAEQDNTAAQLKADEKFFEETKAGCKATSIGWAERSALRTSEIQGIAKGIEILTSPEAQQIFSRSSTTFLQVSAKSGRQAARVKVFSRLSTLAAKYGSFGLAKLATKVETSGHFDKIMLTIDRMITSLRKEEQEDIDHRDRCENGQNANGNQKEDLAHSIDKTQKALGRMGDEETEMKAQLAAVEDEIKRTEADEKERLILRNDAVKEFKQALKDDLDAVTLLEEAIVAISQYYKKNNIPLELVQVQGDPEYTVDKDKAPEMNWGSGNRKSESGGIISILSLLKEDTENEMKTSRQEDDEAQAQFAKDRAALREALAKQKKSKTTIEKVLADQQGAVADNEAALTQAEADKAEAESMEATLLHDCKWVKTHFGSRRDKRKKEMDGLVEAKNYLAGVEDGTAEDDLTA